MKLPSYDKIEIKNIPPDTMKFIDEITRFLLSKQSRIVLIPLVLLLLVFAAIFVLAGGTAWAPFVYAIF